MLPIVDAPIPEPIRKGKKPRKYPFRQLLPGKSFFIPNLEAGPPEHLVEMASTASQVANSISSHNRRWSIAKMGEADARVFRYAKTEDGLWFQVWRES